MSSPDFDQFDLPRRPRKTLAEFMAMFTFADAVEDPAQAERKRLALIDEMRRHDLLLLEPGEKAMARRLGLPWVTGDERID